MKKTKPKELKAVPVQKSRPIRGAFVYCCRVVQNELRDPFLIKLSAINVIVPIIEDDKPETHCLFYTYKDCCYVVDLPMKDLRDAINSFIFEPETHWESYGI